MSEEKKKRVSVIKKSIERTYKIAEYESVRVFVGFEEEIEWETVSDRRKKVKNWNTLLISDFNETVQEVFKDQAVTQSKAFHKAPGEKTYSPMQEGSNSSPSVNINNLDGLE